ncbi:MAG: hypothetical protein ACREQV_10555, partial [Candidatus Binatia bacterium]
MIVLLRHLFFAMLLLLSGYTAFQWSRDHFSDAFSEPPKDLVLPTPPSEHEVAPALSMLIVQIDGEREAKRILECVDSGCRTQVQPSSSGADPLFDGESWYRYTLREGEESILTLTRTWQNGHEETVIEQTPLARPRDLYINHQGTKVAYWLDNIVSDDNLTELWVYDSEDKSTRLLVEKLVGPDIITQPRWNGAGTHIWFLVDSGSGDEEQLELLLADTIDFSSHVAFPHLDLARLRSVLDRGAMDISRDGKRVAYAERISREASKLVITTEEGDTEEHVIRGQIPYIEWLPEGELLYAVQDGPEVIFWRQEAQVSYPVTRLEGIVRSAQSAASGNALAFIVTEKSGSLGGYVLHIESGRVKKQNHLPVIGEHVYLVGTEVEELAQRTAALGITSPLRDEELVAFVEKHAVEITGEGDVSLRRIRLTDQPNVLYLEYEAGERKERLLLLVQDATHPEWIIKARYKPAAATWRKVQGGGGLDPEPQRLYEWEES